jgi:hypothetical protein
MDSGVLLEGQPDTSAGWNTNPVLNWESSGIGPSW